MIEFRRKEGENSKFMYDISNIPTLNILNWIRKDREIQNYFCCSLTYFYTCHYVCMTYKWSHQNLITLFVFNQYNIKILGKCQDYKWYNFFFKIIISITFYRCSWRYNDSGWRPRISSRRTHRFWRIFEIRNQGNCWKKCPSFTIWRKFRCSKKSWISDVNNIDFALLRNCFLRPWKQSMNDLIAA